MSGEPDEVASAARFEMIGAARGVEAHIACAEIGADALPVGDHRHLSLEALAQAMAIAVVDIDDRAASLLPLGGEAFEKRGLGLEVLLHRLVIIEMVLREIRENGRVEFDARGRDAARARGSKPPWPRPCFRHQASGRASPEGPAIRGGARSVHLALPDAIFDGSNESATALVGVKKVLDEKSGGRLAIGAGDAHDA